MGVALGVDFGQAGKRAVRFSYASSEENIREATRRLWEYLGEQGVAGRDQGKSMSFAVLMLLSARR